MIVVFIDVKNKEASVKEIENDLDTFYELIGCDIIEAPTRKIGNNYYDIICDEEGKLKDNKVSAISDSGEVLVGNLIICKSKGEEFVGLEEKEVNEVVRNISRTAGENGYWILNY